MGGKRISRFCSFTEVEQHASKEKEGSERI